jgi:hypothetical protein
MVNKNSCIIRKKNPKGCYRQCMDWTLDTHKSMDEQLKYDIKQLKNGEKHVEQNINIIVLVVLFLFFCFLVFILFNLKSK